MSTPFQNRIVGTVIVAAIAIIFLPDLLDGNKKNYRAEFENIPQAPKIIIDTELKKIPLNKLNNIKENHVKSNEIAQDDVPSTELATETTTDLNTLTKMTDDLSQLSNPTVNVNTLGKPENIKEKTVNNTKKPESDEVKPLPNKINIEEAWVIQLGSFRHKKNVEELIEKLKYHGYTTFTRPIETKTGSLTKVFIGPDINKSSLESKILSLKTLTRIKGKVTRFYPAQQ